MSNWLSLYESKRAFLVARELSLCVGSDFQKLITRRQSKALSSVLVHHIPFLAFSVISPTDHIDVVAGHFATIDLVFLDAQIAWVAEDAPFGQSNDRVIHF